MSKISPVSETVSIPFKKRTAYSLLAATILVLSMATVLRSVMEDIVTTMVRGTGMGLMPTIVWAATMSTLAKSGYSPWRKAKYIAGSTFCLLVILMMMSYWKPWRGFWGFFTDGGLVALSGTIGADLAGEGFQRLLFITVCALAVFLLLAPPDFLRRLTQWVTSLIDLVVDRVYYPGEPGSQSVAGPVLVDDTSDETNWTVPDIDFPEGEHVTVVTESEIREKTERIKNKLAEFGVRVEVPVEDVRTGPRVSVYGIRPTRGVRVADIQAREEDLDVELGTDVRFEGVSRTQGLMGLEVPNSSTTTVRLEDLVKNPDFARSRWEHDLLLALGMDSGGSIVLSDLCDMPNLLIGGATNSGKSVLLNGLLSSLLLLNKPSDLRLLLIDPKQVEFRYYEDIPHLVPNENPGNVVIDPRTAEQVLGALQEDMSYRHRLLASLKVKNIREYNRKSSVNLPYVVVVIDELASLIHNAPRVKTKLVQLTQRGRAVGIHAIIATQRPEVQIIDGLIKAQFPARVALTVASVRDSMTILDVGGAQKLLGCGDMLFKNVSDPHPVRVQGMFVHDDEIAGITEYWRNHPTDQLLSDGPRVEGPNQS